MYPFQLVPSTNDTSTSFHNWYIQRDKKTQKTPAAIKRKNMRKHKSTEK